MKELWVLIEKIFEAYDITSDPRSKGENPLCYELNDEFMTKTKDMPDDEIKALLDDVDKEHWCSLYPALSVMVEDRPFIEKYL